LSSLVGAGIDVSAAQLFGADFTYSDLRRVRLNGAVLRNIDLSYAVLREANLRNSTLFQVILSGADLRNVDFTNATIVSCYFIDAVLSEAPWGQFDRASGPARSFQNHFSRTLFQSTEYAPSHLQLLCQLTASRMWSSKGGVIPFQAFVEFRKHGEWWATAMIIGFGTSIRLKEIEVLWQGSSDGVETVVAALTDNCP
jgi:hypothetical protein